MQSNILNIENWSSYKDEVGTHYTYKINNHYTYELYIGYPIQYCPICGKKLK